MLNKHENPSDTSKSKRQKQKTKRMYDEHIEHGCKRECGQGTLNMYTVFIYLTKVNIK